MKSSFLNRYLNTLNRYKWLALGCFTLCVGVSGVMAFQIEPLPKYIAAGSLTANSPTLSLSNTTNQIVQQGQQLSVELLLADNVIKAVADKMQVELQEVREHLLLRPPTAERPGMLQVMYRDDDPKQASEAVSYLMQAMVQQSRLVNVARLKQVVETVRQRLPQAQKELKDAEDKLYQYVGGDEQERSRLERQVTVKKETVDKLQTALADVESAESEIVSSLAIAQAPQVAETKANLRFFKTLGIGILAGLLVSSGLILLLTFITKQPNRAEFRRKLLEAYKGRCPITGCDVEDALEVVRLDPYKNIKASDLWNGLILRADIEKLFNAKKMAIEPVNLKVQISPELANTSYGKLAGRRLALPEDEESRPNLDALEWRYRQCQWIGDEKGEPEEKG